MPQLFSYKVLFPVALILAIIPFGQPHLPEKIHLLLGGTLSRPLDILDLCWHAWPLVLLGIKAGRDLGRRLLPGQRD